MKTSLKILLAAGVLCGAGLAATAPAAAQPSGFSFRIGDVALAYHDGYYDRGHRWHAWRHARERDWYAVNYRHAYRGYRHDRDHDGVPNWRDDHPNNPYRR